MEGITDQQVAEILNSSIGTEEWETRLGQEIDDALVGAVNHFDFNASEFGRQMWKGFNLDLHAYFCKDGKPREWLTDVITGDVRNLVVSITSAITAKYDVTIAIAIPITALMLKTGILNYCANKSEQNSDKLFNTYKGLLARHSKKKKRRKKK